MSLTRGNRNIDGAFTTLADLQASRPRVDTQVSLNGVVYLIGEADKGKGVAVNGLFANPIGDIINVAQYGYDNSGIIAAIAAAKALAGSLGDQYPSDTLVTLHFPSGHYNSGGALIDISVGATGFNITGEGFTSQLDNIQITMNGAIRCSIGNFLMRGALGYGINSNQDNPSNLSRQNTFYGIYIRDKTTGVIINGSTWNTWSNITVEKSSGDGWHVIATSGEEVSGCYSFSNSGKGVFIEAGGEFKVSGISCHNNVGFGIHLKGDDTAAVVENYFENTTSTIQNRTRLLTITAIVAHTDGIQVTTSAPHELAVNMIDIRVTGTTNYNGTHSTITIIDSNNFTLDAAYVANESSGQVDLPNWDLVIESDSTVNYRVNDQYFDGGNFNYIKVIKAFNVTFCNTRIKSQFWIGADSNMILRSGSARGRTINSFDSVEVSGDGLDGLLEIVANNDSSSSTSGNASLRSTVANISHNFSSLGASLNGIYTGVTSVLSDDTVHVFKPDFVKGIMRVSNGAGQNARYAEFAYDTTTGNVQSAGFKGFLIDFGAGVHTGTTGTDGRITIAADTNGNMYLENRNGTQKLFWTIFR